MSKELSEKLASIDLKATTKTDIAKEQEELKTSKKSLDDLIEEYLIQLDEYSSAQKKAGDEFSKVCKEGRKYNNYNVTFLTNIHVDVGLSRYGKSQHFYDDSTFRPVIS